MHIVHVLTRFLRAGSEENTVATCRWQVAKGHRVTLLHGADSDPYWDRNPPPRVKRIAIPELVHPIRPDLDLRALRRLRAEFATLAPDVIHTHQSKAGILGRLAARAIPHAVVVHGIHIVPFEQVDPVRRAFYIGAERMAARRTDVFIGVSDAMGAAFAKAGICPQVHTVRSGMDLSRFEHAPPPEDWRQILNVGPGHPRPKVAVMLAAFEPRKRHEAFLRAFAHVAPDLPDLRIILAGAGSELEHAQSAVRLLGLQDQVIFVGHRPDPEALLSLADLSLLTSAREGLPRVAVQSIAAGCPMLVQALPGISEVIKDGQNGYVLPADDMQAFVHCLAETVSNPVRLRHLRKGARESDVSDWSLDALGSRTTALYQVPGRARLGQAA